MTNKTSNPEYWNELYRNNETGWDIGYPSPALKEYIDQLANTSISILIPGCGNSYEADYLLQKGFTDITLIDISPLLTAELEKKYHGLSHRPKVITGNFFGIKGQYDLILEQTFLSALDPSLRKSYAEQMHALLKPGGKLVGVLFGKEFEDGPPYGGNAEEYETLFKEKFMIKTLSPCYNSIDRRTGSEVFINLIAKS